jgi:hypothetical protein
MRRFIDPDDLLSYWVNPELHHFNVCNVLLRNRKYDFADPLAAHLNYDQNPIVLKMMWEGVGSN